MLALFKEINLKKMTTYEIRRRQVHGHLLKPETLYVYEEICMNRSHYCENDFEMMINKQDRVETRSIIIPRFCLK